MTGQAVVRVLFVIVLIVTAHVIRPFSMKNVSNHLFESSRSIASILPDSARAGFDNANLLALTLSNSLFDGEAANQIRSFDSIPASSVIAMQLQPSAQSGKPEVDQAAPAAETSDVKWIRIDRKARARAEIVRVDSDNEAEDLIASIPDQSAESEEATAGEEGDAAELGGAAGDTVEPAIAPVASSVASFATVAELPEAKSFATIAPVALPNLRLNQPCALGKIKPINPVVIERIKADLLRIETIFLPRKSDCEKGDAKTVRIIAFLEQPKKVIKESILSVLECDTDRKEPEAEINAIEAGPEEESQAERMEVQPFVIPASPSMTASDRCEVQPK